MVKLTDKVAIVTGEGDGFAPYPSPPRRSALR